MVYAATVPRLTKIPNHHNVAAAVATVAAAAAAVGAAAAAVAAAAAAVAVAAAPECTNRLPMPKSLACAPSQPSRNNIMYENASVHLAKEELPPPCYLKKSLPSYLATV